MAWSEAEVAHRAASDAERIAWVDEQDNLLGALVRSDLRERGLIGEGGFRASHVIFPEQTVTDYLLKLIEFPEALQVLEFADGGETFLVGLRASF